MAGSRKGIRCLASMDDDTILCCIGKKLAPEVAIRLIFDIPQEIVALKLGLDQTSL